MQTLIQKLDKRDSQISENKLLSCRGDNPSHFCFLVSAVHLMCRKPCAF